MMPAADGARGKAKATLSDGRISSEDEVSFHVQRMPLTMERGVP